MRGRRGPGKALRSAVLAGLAGLALACESPPPPTVEYSGCWTVSVPGPVCVLRLPDPGKSSSLLTLWVQADAGTAVEIRAGNLPLEGAGEEVQNGRRFALAVPPTASSLKVRLRLPDGTQGRAWSLALAPPKVPAWVPGVQAMERAGRRRETRGYLERIQKTAPPDEQGLILWMLALLARQEGRDKEAMAYLEQGRAVDRRQGMLSRELGKMALIAQIHLDDGRFADARRVLSLPAGAPADARFWMAYYQGLLAERVGDYRRALEQVRQAADQAERVGRSAFRWKAEQVLARVLQKIGRSREASELFARLRAAPSPETPSDMGTLLTNEAWSRLLAQEAGEETADPVPMLQEARKIFDADKSCRPEQRLNARLNLVFAYQQADRWQEARRALQEVRPFAARANLRQRLWWLDLEAREAITEGRPEHALRLYGELSELAGNALSLEGSFRAAVGRAHARLALGTPGQRSAAIEDLAAADRLLDEQTWLIPAFEGRDTFLGQREVATRLYLELLLEDGHRQRAFAQARRSRSRLLHQLTVRDRLAQLTQAEQQRWDRALSRYWELRNATERRTAEEWQLAGDQVEHARADRSAELAAARQDLDAAMAALGAPGDSGAGSLAPPGPGEVVLAYHPLARGWVGFAASAGDVKVSFFDPSARALANPDSPRSLEPLARSLIEPFREVLEKAERVRVLPYGPLQAVDFHALPLAGEPLLARHLVVYSLDMPAHSFAALPARPVALLVVDPEGNLPAADREAKLVGAAISSWGRGWILKRLDGTAARTGAVRQALLSADLFHFAGHGKFAGFGGWDSALQLADGLPLTLSDLMALHRVPSWVVLSACDGGRASAQAPGEGIGLAQVFLLAGSRAVIATTRPVADRTARDLIAELYQGWQPGEDLPRQLQRAQLALRRRNPAADWASFRLFER